MERQTSIQSIGQLKSAMGLQARKTFHTIAIHHLKIPPYLHIEEALAQLRGNRIVEYAEPNYIIRALFTLDDPQFNQLWGLNNTGQTGGAPDADIDAPEAWDIYTGSSDVVIAVIDTGVAYNHPDLDDGTEKNMWTNGAELNGTPGIDDDGNGYVDDVRGIDPTVTTLLSEDFDSGLGNWTSWGNNDTWGTSGDYYTSAPNSLADSPFGNYFNNTDSYITYNTPFNLVDKFVSMDIGYSTQIRP